MPLTCPPLPLLACPRCKPLLIATYNPEEGPLREHLCDRIAITLSADVPSTKEDRVLAIDTAMRFQDMAQLVLDETGELTGALQTSVGGVLCVWGGGRDGHVAQLGMEAAAAAAVKSASSEGSSSYSGGGKHGRGGSSSSSGGAAAASAVAAAGAGLHSN